MSRFGNHICKEHVLVGVSSLVFKALFVYLLDRFLYFTVPRKHCNVVVFLASIKSSEILFVMEINILSTVHSYIVIDI